MAVWGPHRLAVPSHAVLARRICTNIKECPSNTKVYVKKRVTLFKHASIIYNIKCKCKSIINIFKFVKKTKIRSLPRFSLFVSAEMTKWKVILTYVCLHVQHDGKHNFTLNSLSSFYHDKFSKTNNWYNWDYIHRHTHTKKTQWAWYLRNVPFRTSTLIRVARFLLARQTYLPISDMRADSTSSVLVSRRSDSDTCWCTYTWNKWRQ